MYNVVNECLQIVNLKSYSVLVGKSFVTFEIIMGGYRAVENWPIPRVLNFANCIELYPMLSPMDGNIPHTPPPSTPPSKRRRVDAPHDTRLPSFDEEPHSSPAKIGELGLHVLLSPKHHDTRTERIDNVARSLTFSEDTKSVETNAEDDALEYWDRPRESMYVTAFNTAVDTVIEREGHLFSQEETDIISLYRNLPCITPLGLRINP